MAEATILKYLVDGNRPYSIQNLIDAFKSQGIAKAQLTRILDSLVASNSIMLIENNKQKIYLGLQTGGTSDPQDERAEEAEIEKLKQRVEAEGKTAAELQNSLRSLGSAMTLDALQAALAVLEPENAEMEARLVKLRAGGVLVSAEDREEAESAALALFDEWSKRRRQFKGLWGEFTENNERSARELKEEVGWCEDSESSVDFEETKKVMTGIRNAQLAAKRQRVAR